MSRYLFQQAAFENPRSMAAECFRMVLKGKSNSVLFPCNFTSLSNLETAGISHLWVKRQKSLVFFVGESRIRLIQCCIDQKGDVCRKYF